MAIGNKIVELRKKYNFTQEKLAEKIGVSRQTLSNWESDITSPNLAEAGTLSKILKISLDELVDNDIEIECKRSNDIFADLIDKNCYIYFSDDFIDMDINYTTPVKILKVEEDFVKVEYLKKQKKLQKLIDIDLIVAIKAVKGSEL